MRTRIATLRMRDLLPSRRQELSSLANCDSRLGRSYFPELTVGNEDCRGLAFLNHLHRAVIGHLLDFVKSL